MIKNILKKNKYNLMLNLINKISFFFRNLNLSNLYSIQKSYFKFVPIELLLKPAIKCTDKKGKII